MSDTPPDIERLIQDVLSDLGFDADAEEVARRVRRLNYGLPAEDEFSVICAWLGRTRLLHKLDQHQSPIASKTEYQVPDILAKFEAGGPFLIEVKVCNDPTLSFKPAYHAKLTRYASLVGLPLLIAWKHHSLWTLFDISQLTVARKNFNISQGEAMRQNLLGVLAGDVMYKLAEGSGVHFDIAKETLVDTVAAKSGHSELWKMRISGVQFTSGGGETRTDLHPETTQLLATWDLQSTEEHSTSHIRQSFTVGPEGIEFAHRALVDLLDWESGMKERPSWRTVLRSNEITRSITQFEAALNRGLSERVVSHIFHQDPVTRPDFLDKASRKGRPHSGHTRNEATA